MYFEFTDSEVAQCSCEDGQLQLRFSAAHLREDDAEHAQAVWAPMLLIAGEVEPWDVLASAVCIGAMRQGTVLYASQRLHKLAVPCELQGVVTMELEFAQGHVVHLRCQGLSLQLLPGTHSVEAYQC